VPSPLPQHCPSPRELDDLELLLNGALAPRSRFDDPTDPRSTLTLTLPDELRGRDVELVDPEGLPLAQVTADSTVTGLAHPAFGPFRRLYLHPQQTRVAHAERSWIPVDDALTSLELNRLAQRGPVVLAALVGHGTPKLSPVALIRATLAAADLLPDAVVVAIPLADHPDAPAGTQARLRERVVAAYAGAAPVWPLTENSPARTLEDLPESVATIVRADRPAPDEQGLVLFFTGLSGSGKSTLARALTDRLLEQGRRSVTSLDGDVVRRNLSAGLTFSNADRETNIRRIGWVAAEIARHGGVAVCSPIAPFDETRQQVREYVEAAGGRFFLVHVATPLAECERRDRKGLYAKARAGEIASFTGISDPYEPPVEPAVEVRTDRETFVESSALIIAALAARGLA
jgi:sulfate adenylyltransferase